MNYIGCFFTIESGSLPAETAIEILIAELGAAGFESFTEKSKGLVAYIQKEQWDPELLNDIQILDSEEIKFIHRVKEIEQVNWNEEWEKNFDPIVVDGEVSIRAPFHKDPGLKYDIVIEPKMSFGTGHHETTHLMIQHLMHLDLEGKTVLDMGCGSGIQGKKALEKSCGTGILAIFAEMRCAKSIDAIDIDSWCYENSRENAERNKCKFISVFEGDAKLLKPNRYEVIIANINRNILLNDMSVYAESLKENGVLLLSGFYTEDIEIIDAAAASLGMKMVDKLERNNWVGLKYVN